MSKYLDQFNERRAFAHFTKGATVQLPRSGTLYTLEHVRNTASGVPIATIKRAIPKPQGKAGRKAAKAARRRARGCL